MMPKRKASSLQRAIWEDPISLPLCECSCIPRTSSLNLFFNKGHFKAYTTIPMRYVKMPTTAPAISTNTSTLVIPFLRSAFSPKKCPALNKNPIRKITPKSKGKIDLMVSETSLTESSIPPICANVGRLIRSIAHVR